MAKFAGIIVHRCTNRKRERTQIKIRFATCSSNVLLNSKLYILETEGPSKNANLYNITVFLERFASTHLNFYLEVSGDISCSSSSFALQLLS